MVARGDLGVQLPLERIPLIQAEILKTDQRGRPDLDHGHRDARVDDQEPPAHPSRGDRRRHRGDRRNRRRDAVGRDRRRRLPGADCRRHGRDLRGDGGGHAVESWATTRSRSWATATQWPRRFPKRLPRSPINLEAETIVAFTESGNTARLISKYRPEARIVAFSPNDTTLNQMALYWGVSPHEFERRTYTDEEMAAAVGHPGEGRSGQQGGQGGHGGRGASQRPGFHQPGQGPGDRRDLRRTGFLRSPPPSPLGDTSPYGENYPAHPHGPDRHHQRGDGAR